ncbi:hypothetical protein BGP77_17325 [Saccharospirillum sp. MSK14-1]|uniref:molybdenum cofactor guanylyltransferase n=1 Tax=Saccharospirillum sp. MSK14-1 TaxID=1897632 RepID=UPI000D3BBE27|nr:molybdenum cofactor guanylyltransferase [Saccharospirillum sp. MSK14-1]PTY38205.1 hypothetical protein BGP77_17325 [Saccharospirillum sp. MSK14-1]
MNIKTGALLLLAGGRSRRMGSDKAQLAIAGTTLLNWQRQRLRALDLPIWHSGPDGIVDQWPDFQGPLAGLHSALRQQPNVEFWLLMPVDMPNLPVGRLRQLAVCVADKGVPVAFQGSPLPLAVPATERITETLETWLSQSDGPRSIRALMTTFDGYWLEASLSDDEQLNVNTPEDWQAFLQALKEQPL